MPKKTAPQSNDPDNSFQLKEPADISKLQEEFRRTVKKHPNDFQANSIAYAHFAAQIAVAGPILNFRHELINAFAQIFPDPDIIKSQINK